MRYRMFLRMSLSGSCSWNGKRYAVGKNRNMKNEYTNIYLLFACILILFYQEQNEHSSIILRLFKSIYVL